MRIQLEDNRTPLNEFINSLGTLHEPVELVRNGEVVATVAASDKKPYPKKISGSRNTVNEKEARKDKAAKNWANSLPPPAPILPGWG